MSIKGGNQEFSWIEFITKLNLPPTIGMEAPTAAPVTEEEVVVISKSPQKTAQEIARDMAALLLLPPSLLPTLFKEIVSDIKNKFNIANVSSAGESAKTYAPVLMEQQIVLSMLNQWNQSIQDASEVQKQDANEEEIKHQEISYEILRDYYNQTAIQQGVLTSSITSPVIGSLLTNAASLQAASEASPFVAAMTGKGESIPLLQGIAPRALAVASTLTLGLIAASTTWAAPVAMALSRATSSLSPEQVNQDSAKAYAVSLSAFLMNPSFEDFFSSQLDRALGSATPRG